MFEIFKPISDELEMSKTVLIKIDESELGKNPDLIVLCNIIQGRLHLNILQHIIVEEVLSYFISNKRCQCQNWGKSLLSYIRKREELEKAE